MKKISLSAVVFDCDGVLIESDAAKTRAFGETVIAEFGAQAAEQLMAHHRANGGISRISKFRWFYSEIVKAPLTDEKLDSLCQRFTAICLDTVLTVPMVPGAQECLDFLFPSIPLFVASGTPQQELEHVLGYRSLSSYFTGICGTPPEKHELLKQILTANNLDPAQVLMVGDASTDLDAARYNNCLFYGRGEYFADQNVPWSQDLRGLYQYLTSIIRSR